MQFTFQQAGTGGKRKSKLPTAEEYARYLAAGDTDVRKPPSAKGYADYLQTREGQAGRDRDAYDSRVRQSYKERRLAAEEAEKAANIVQAGDKTFTISKNFLPGGQLGELRQEDISAREKEKARREEQLDALSKKRGEGVSFLDKGEMEEIGETADAYFRKAPLNTGKRIWYGAGNIGKTMTGAAPLIAETADAAREEAAASRRKRENDPDYARYYGQLSETLARLEALRDEVRQSDKPAGETEEEIARLEGDVNRLEGILREKGEAYAPVLPDTWGMERLREARGDAEKALEGLSPGGQFLGSAALSVGQNLALMPTAVINPALPLAGMGVLSAADKMFGLNERGVRPGEALFRGAVAGGIEALTEKIPLDSVIDMVKAGGRGFVKNMLRQAGTEATEEGISYALNYLADKAARDPEAGFSVAELLESAAAGGLSGLFFGLGGTALGRVTGSAQGRAGTVATAGETQTAAGAYPGMAAANAGQSALSGQNNAAPTEGTAKGFSSEFPEVVTPMFWNKEYKNNPDRQAAKKGDEVAAKRLVDSIVTQEFADQVGRRFSGAEIVPVVDIETKDGNVLAKEFAKTLSERSGLTLNGSIGKMNRTTHAKAKNAFQRLLQRAKFSGDITPGQTYYLIADDFVSLGSTASDLKRYIESKGGRVAGVTALSASGEASLRLAPSEEKIARLEGFGREEVESVLQKYGIVDTLEELTDAEAGVLLRVADFDTVRKGLVPFHEELDARLHREGAGGDGGQGTVPLRMADAGGSGHAAGVADTSGENARGRDILASETDQEVYGNGEAGVGPASFMPERTEAELAERLPAYGKLLSGRALSESEAARIQGDEGAVAALRAKGYVIEGSPAEQRQTIKAIARGEIAPQRGGDAPMSAWRYEDMGRPAGEENAAERAERAKAALMEEEAAGPDAPDFESVQPPVYYGGTWESVKRTTESGKRLGVEAGRVRRAAELSHTLRVPVEFYRGGGEHGYYEGGAIYLNAGSDHPAADVFFHELTHFVEQGEKSYTKFLRELTNSKTMAKWLKENGITMQDLEAAVKEQQPGLDDIGIDREIAALFAEKYLFKDDGAINSLARSDKGLFSRLRNYVSYLAQKLKGSSFDREILKLQRMYEKAFRAAKKAGTHTDTGRKYSLNPDFKLQFDEWLSSKSDTDRQTDGGYFQVGRTSDALKSIGIRDGSIYWRKQKIGYIMSEHPEIDGKTIKSVPEIIENPIIVMKSQTRGDSIVLFGDVTAANGKKVMAALELTPRSAGGMEAEFSLITSAYGRSDENIRNLIQGSEILYLDPNKNRTNAWLMSLRVQFPSDQLAYGSIGSVAYQDGKVKINGTPFSQDMQKGKKDAQKSDGRKYRVRMDIFDNPFVEIDGDLLDGVPKSEWINTVKDALKRKYPDGLQIPGWNVEVTKRSRDEFTRSEYSKNLNIYDSGMYADKFRLANNMDEVVGVSTGTVNESPKHPRKDNIRSFNRGQVNLRVGKNDYSADVVTAILSSGREIVYDVVNLRPIKIATEVTHSEAPRNSRAAQNLVTSANTSKAQGGTGVNTQDMQKGKKDAQRSVKSPDEIIRIAAERRALLPKEAQEGADMDSAFAESIQKSKIFSPDFIAKAEADPRITRYKSVANEEVMAEAAADIAKSGDKAVYIFMNKPPAAATAKDVAKGFILLHRFQAAGEYEAAIAVTQKLREMGTAAGQTVQIYSILGRLTPEGMTMYAQRELDALYERLKMIKTEGWLRANKEKFRLTPEDMDFIRARVEKAARLPEGRDKNILLAEICSRVQAKIPPTKSKSIKAWARASMLFNSRTNVRNVLGNAVIMPMHAVSDFIGAGLDKAISAKTGVRTTGMYDPRSVKGMAKGAYESYDDFRRKINTRDLSGDRYEIGEGPSFKTDWNGDRFGAAGRGAAVLGNAMGRALNALDRTASFLLDLGDRPFYEMWFVNSLNNQMKLNKASEATAEMIDIARQEALDRTWQDNNSFTRSLTKLRDGLNEIGEGFHIGTKEFGLGNLVFAFTKTPANLAKAMWEFSPMGLTYALSNEAKRFYSAVEYGTVTPQMQKSFVTHMGKATAGSIAFASFVLMAAAGVITGAGDEDRDAAAFQKDVMGVRPYSIRIGNTTYTYDWAQPVGGLMAAAADIVRSWEEMDGGDKFDRTAGLAASAILNALAAGGNSGFKQSVYTGLSELFSSDDIMQGLIEVAAGLPAMMTPVLSQQIAQMGDPVARTSYEAGDPWGTMVNQVKAKIPGLRQTLAPQVDVLGREVAAKTDIFNVMLNPANQSAAQTTEAANEIWDLYQKTGDKRVFPAKAPYSVSKGGQTYRMTSRERADYQKAMGGMASEAISELVANPYYSLLPDEAKVELLKDIYAYGRDKASEALGFARSDKYKKAYMAEEMGISPGTYYLYNATANRDGEGDVTQEEAEETIDAMDLTMEQKAYLWALQDAGWSSKSNPYKRRYKIEGFTKR